MSRPEFCSPKSPLSCPPASSFQSLVASASALQPSEGKAAQERESSALQPPVSVPIGEAAACRGGKRGVGGERRFCG